MLNSKPRLRPGHTIKLVKTKLYYRSSNQPRYCQFTFYSELTFLAAVKLLEDNVLVNVFDDVVGIEASP